MKRILQLGAVALIGVAIAKQWPDIMRYLKIKSM